MLTPFEIENIIRKNGLQSLSGLRFDVNFKEIAKKENKMVKIGVIGFGCWGPNLVRNFSDLDNCLVKTVVDLNVNRLSLVPDLLLGSRRQGG